MEEERSKFKDEGSVTLFFWEIRRTEKVKWN